MSPRTNPLKKVGYWKSADNRRYPKPQWLVRPGWHAGESDQIVGYLRAGNPCLSWFGASHCRFRVCRQANGSSDFTDGEWIWPEGLAHYLEKHSVILPEEFVSA